MPGTPSLEKDGTFTNTERRVQRLYQALEPLGDSKPDWVIFQEAAKRMGYDWNYSHPSEIFAEMASLTPFFSQCNYEVLEGWNSFSWGSPDGKDTPAYKQTKVRMEVLNDQGENPLPRTNPRYKKRHPQNGVEVQRKWARPEYVSLVD